MKPTNTKEISALQTKVDKLKAETWNLEIKNLNLQGQIKANEFVIDSQNNLASAYEDHIKFLRGLDEPTNTAPVDSGYSHSPRAND